MTGAPVVAPSAAAGSVWGVGRGSPGPPGVLTKWLATGRATVRGVTMLQMAFTISGSFDNEQFMKAEIARERTLRKNKNFHNVNNRIITEKPTVLYSYTMEPSIHRFSKHLPLS